MKNNKETTLAEALYRDIDKNEYLGKIYRALLYNYLQKLLPKDVLSFTEIDIKDALRFADLLSKSQYPPTAERDHQWGQAIAVLLKELYSEEPAVKYYLNSSLLAVGNYQGTKTADVAKYNAEGIFDQIYYESEKAAHLIPGSDGSYFYPAQKTIYDNLGKSAYSYSGSPSIGKDSLCLTYISESIRNGGRENYAVIVPSSAAALALRDSLIGILKEQLRKHNYKIITSADDPGLAQEHSFIFIMSHENLLIMTENGVPVNIDRVFIEDASQISSRGDQSAYYYEILSRLSGFWKNPSYVFASENIPNPEIYFDLIPDPSIKKESYISAFSPRSHFYFYIDSYSDRIYYHDNFTGITRPAKQIKNGSERLVTKTLKRLNKSGVSNQNLVFCSTSDNAISLARDYAECMNKVGNERQQILSAAIRDDMHNECFLAELAEKGIAYLTDELPRSIIKKVKRAYEEGDINTVFYSGDVLSGSMLSADNLLITNCKRNGIKFDELDVNELIGHAGRIDYSLCGNIFFLCLPDGCKIEEYAALIHKSIPKQVTALDRKELKCHFETVITDLTNGDVDLPTCRKKARKDYRTLRKYALLLIRDIAYCRQSPVLKAFSPYLTDETKDKIRRHFSDRNLCRDVFMSFDQKTNLIEAIEESYMEYPRSTTEPYWLKKFLSKLRTVFRWDLYEIDTIERGIRKESQNMLDRYASIIIKWINGASRNEICQMFLSDWRWVDRNGIEQNNIYIRSDEELIKYKNRIIEDTAFVLDEIICHRIAEYFRKFSAVYKEYKRIDKLDNDWYEYIIYGTTDPAAISLQKEGFDREAALYITAAKNRERLLTESSQATGTNTINIKKEIFDCGNYNVVEQAILIKYNSPKLFEA